MAGAALISTPCAAAADFFVRPAEKGVARGDGSTYETPFRGFDAIDWTQLGHGRLYVCGTHRQTLLVGASDVVVDLDCPDDPGVVLGSEYLSGDNPLWKARDGKYSFRLPAAACAGNGIGLLVRDGAVQRKGEKATLAPDEWALSRSKFSDACLLLVGRDPADSAFEYGARRVGIGLPDADVRNITISGGEVRYAKGWGIGQEWEYHRRNYGRFVVRDVLLYGHGQQGIHAYVPPELQEQNDYYLFDEVVIERNRILETGGEGVYIRGHNAVRGRLHISANRIGSASHDNFGWDSNFGDYAGDALDVHAGHPALVENNVITNVQGIGINLAVGDALVRGNQIEDAFQRQAKHPYKAGIVVAPRRYCAGSASDVVVRDNQISNQAGVALMVTGDVALRCSMLIENNRVSVASPEWDVVSWRSRNNANIRLVRNTIRGGRFAVAIYGDTPINSEVSANSMGGFAESEPIYVEPPDRSGLRMLDNQVVSAGP